MLFNSSDQVTNILKSNKDIKPILDTHSKDSVPSPCPYIIII